MGVTLKEALKTVVEHDHVVNKYDAKVLREILLADGKVTKEEKDVLEHAFKHDHFDEDAMDILQEVILRSDLDQPKHH